MYISRVFTIFPLTRLIILKSLKLSTGKTSCTSARKSGLIAKKPTPVQFEHPQYPKVIFTFQLKIKRNLYRAKTQKTIHDKLHEIKQKHLMADTSPGNMEKNGSYNKYGGYWSRSNHPCSSLMIREQSPIVQESV